MQIKLYPLLKHTIEEGVLDVIVLLVPLKVRLLFFQTVYSDLISWSMRKIKSGSGSLIERPKSRTGVRMIINI